MDTERLDRQTGYFHRFLGDMLQDLVTHEEVEWLEGDAQKRQHAFRGDGEKNTDGRAPSLSTQASRSRPAASE